MRCVFARLGSSSSVFARLGSSSSVRMLSSIPRKSLRGVVFDIDGTLTVPNLDFKVMYARCGVPPAADIIEAVAAMPSAEKAAAESVIEELEEESRRTLQLCLAPSCRQIPSPA